MSLLKEQSQVSNFRGMPVNEKNDTSSVQSISGETVAFFYSNSGTRTADAGQSAGVAVEAVLARNNIMNSTGKMQATKVDTSLSFTSTAFTTEVPINKEIMESLDEVAWADRLSTLTAGLANGEYVVDYTNGILYGKKASTQTSLASAAYKVQAGSEVVLGTVTVTGGGVSQADDSAFTPATSSVAPMGAFADETATDSVDEGDVGAVRMTLNRRIITAGQTADDAAPETGTKVTMIGGIVDSNISDVLDDGDAGYARIDESRNLFQTLGTLISGEDQTNNVMRVRFPGSNAYISSATTTTVKSGSGYLRSITVGETAAGAITIYDNTAGSGTVIGVLKASIAERTYYFESSFATGLTIVTAAASKISVCYM